MSTDSKRIVIGSEVNDDRKVELDSLGSKITVPVSIYDSSGNQVNLASGLVPEIYDYIALTYTGSNLTGVVYKSGGSGGSTVATLTLAYTGSVLDSITRT